MPRRRRKAQLQDAFDAIAGFRDLVDGTLEALTGKRIAAWLREFQQQPKELPGGEEATDQQPSIPVADAYAILGLKPDAPLEDVKKHYRQLANVFHTDKGGMNEEAMKLINRAYERITKGKGGN